MKKIRTLFLNLVEIGAPSGFEEPVMRFLTRALEPRVDEVWHTSRGNVLGVKKGTDSEAPKIALVAHMDQVGFIVFNIDERGFIMFRKIGGSVNRAIEGQQLRLLGEKEPIVGVAGIKPGHITPPEESNKVPPIEDLYIDVGAESREEVKEMGIKIGTPIVYHTSPLDLANDQIASPAVDDRAGLTAILMVSEHLKDEEIPSTIHYVGSVEEEVGLRGAEVALHGLDVDMAVAIDTFPAGYQPDVNMRDLYYEVGKGPAIHIGEISGGRTRLQSQIVGDWLRWVAEEEDIPYQAGLMQGGTDASALMQTGEGIPACTVGIPRKYSHSPIETFNMRDLENLIKLLTTALKGLDSDFSTSRIGY
ncbi:MAG: M42 family metallopeptidase [Candidatus Bathyarchaeia archaeon]